MNETMFDEDEDDGTPLDLLDLDLLLETELECIPSPVNSNIVETLCTQDKGSSISLFDDSVEIDFIKYTISENTGTEAPDNTSEWTELLQYSSEFIYTVQSNLQLPNSDDAINRSLGLTEGIGNDFILSSQTIEEIINSLGSDENKITASFSDNKGNFDIEYEVRQTLELMITSVECCAPIYSAHIDDAHLQIVKAGDHPNLHIIEDDNSADNFQSINTDTAESRQQIHDDTMSEMLQQTRLSKSIEERDAASLEHNLEMELQQALEQDRQQRRERRLRFEKEAAEALLRKNMAVSQLRPTLK